MSANAKNPIITKELVVHGLATLVVVVGGLLIYDKFVKPMTTKKVASTPVSAPATSEA